MVRACRALSNPCTNCCWLVLTTKNQNDCAWQNWLTSAAYLIHSIQLLQSKPYHPTSKPYYDTSQGPSGNFISLTWPWKWLFTLPGRTLLPSAHLKSYLHSFGFSHDAFDVSSWKIKAFHSLIFFLYKLHRIFYSMQLANC